MSLKYIYNNIIKYENIATNKHKDEDVEIDVIYRIKIIDRK